MFIKYQPKNDPPMKQTTNLGEFTPGQVRGPLVTDRDKRWAKQLITNGEFVETDPAGVPLGVRDLAPAVQTSAQLPDTPPKKVVPAPKKRAAKSTKK